MASSSNSLDGAQSPIRPQSFSESRMWPSDSTISKIFNVRPADFNQSAARRQTFIDPIWNRQPSPPCKLMHVDLVEELNIKKGNSGNLRSTKMAEFVVHQNGGVCGPRAKARSVPVHGIAGPRTFVSRSTVRTYVSRKSQSAVSSSAVSPSSVSPSSVSRPDGIILNVACKHHQKYESKISDLEAENAELRSMLCNAQRARADDQMDHEREEEQQQTEIDELEGEMEKLRKEIMELNAQRVRHQQNITALEQIQADSVLLPRTVSLQSHGALIAQIQECQRWYIMAGTEVESRMRLLQEYAQQVSRLEADATEHRRQIRVMEQQLGQYHCGACLQRPRAILMKCTRNTSHIFYCQQCWDNQRALDVAANRGSQCPICRRVIQNRNIMVLNL